MAPELLLPPPNTVSKGTPPSDVWAFGCVCCEVSSIIHLIIRSYLTACERSGQKAFLLSAISVQMLALFSLSPVTQTKSQPLHIQKYPMITQEI
jgi:serine/threonine protein kinase